MLKDELLALSEQNRPKPQPVRWDRDGLFQEVKRKLQEAASAGERSTEVLVLKEWEMELIDLSGCGASMLDDTPEVIEEALRNIRERTTDHLRGVAAEVVEYFTNEGLTLSLKHRLAGGEGLTSRRRTTYNEWALIASW